MGLPEGLCLTFRLQVVTATLQPEHPPHPYLINTERKSEKITASEEQKVIIRIFLCAQVRLMHVQSEASKSVYIFFV